MVVREERFRRLLRWYPRAWRKRNEVVLLGTMLEDAEQEGRAVPSAAERFSAMVYGLGTRLDARLALRFALAGLVVAAAVRAAVTWAGIPLAQAGAAWLFPLLTVAVCPAFVAVGAVALLRQRGVVSEPRSFVVLALMLPALVLAGLAYVAYGLAFAAANDGVPRTGLAAAWSWLFGAACVTGAAAIAVLVDALLRRAGLRPSVCVGLAVPAGVVLAPVLGLSLTTAYVPALAAAGLALLTLVRRRATRAVPPGAASSAGAAVDAPRRTKGLARVLAVLAAAGSTVGVAYALTGARWLPAGTADGTAVMGQGITIALMSALPLLAAIGVLAAARSRRRPAHTWGPLLLAVLSFIAVAVAYLNAPAWDGMAPGFAVASALGGAAIAWWLIPRLRGPARDRIAIGVLIGIGYAAFLGMLVAPMLAFVLPLMATAFAIWAPRNPRPGMRAPIVETEPRTPDALPSTS